jgi:hypothetical protein
VVQGRPRAALEPPDGRDLRRPTRAEDADAVSEIMTGTFYKTYTSKTGADEKQIKNEMAVLLRDIALGLFRCYSVRLSSQTVPPSLHFGPVARPGFSRHRQGRRGRAPRAHRTETGAAMPAAWRGAGASDVLKARRPPHPVDLIASVNPEKPIRTGRCIPALSRLIKQPPAPPDSRDVHSDGRWTPKPPPDPGDIDALVEAFRAQGIPVTRAPTAGAALVAGC